MISFLILSFFDMALDCRSTADAYLLPRACLLPGSAHTALRRFGRPVLPNTAMRFMTQEFQLGHDADLTPLMIGIPSD